MSYSLWFTIYYYIIWLEIQNYARFNFFWVLKNYIVMKEE